MGFPKGRETSFAKTCFGISVGKRSPKTKHLSRFLIAYLAFLDFDLCSVNPQVVGSSPTGGAMKKPLRKKWFFQLNPPFRVGEILLRNVKSSLCSGEIAAAVGGLNFICEADFIHQRWISSCVSTISLTSNFTIHEMYYFTFCQSKIFH